MSEIIKGILSRDPDLKYTKGGKTVCEGIVYNTAEEEFLNVVAWEEIADDLKEYKKGQKIKFKGYRKFNTFLQKEQVVIDEII